MTPKISEEYIRRLRPPCKPFVACGDSLYLRCHVAKDGTFTRRWLYHNGKSFRSLGSAWPMMSLKHARLEINRILGGNRNMQSTDIVRELVEDWYTNNVAPRRKDKVLIRGYLDREVLPTIGSMKVRDVTASDAMRVLKPIVRRGTLATANRVYDVLRQMFDYGTAHGMVTANPCAPISKRHVGGIERPRQRVLSWAEIKTLLATISTTKEAPIYRLLLLTGLRLNELLKLERAMIDDDVVTLPATSMKSAREHRVYLAPLMQAELKAVMAKQKSPFVFPSETDSKQPHPKSTLQQRWMLIRPEGVTLHDLRRTMRTRCGELGVRPDVCEMMLAHALRGIQGVYDRYSYAKELRAAWALWADKIMELSPKPESAT